MIDTKLILDFWFVQCTPKMWFKKSKSFDELLRSRFKKTIETCLKVKIDEILISYDNYLSYILVLDQFTRNVFRNNSKSFQGDETALMYTLSPTLFEDHLKYLGVFIGPGASLMCCSDVMNSYCECISFLRGIDAGLATTISLYNTLCASTCSWVGSFLPPSADLLILEGKSLQRMTHGPWNVFPKQFLCIAIPHQHHEVRHGNDFSK